jgi:GNAT superfamily N-acetyltransferase
VDFPAAALSNDGRTPLTPALPHVPDKSVRALRADEADLYFAHLLRLEPEAQRMRFFGDTPDFHLALHAGAAVSDGRFCVGYIDNDTIRGAAELLTSERQKPHQQALPEAAFSVEAPYRSQGVGSLLMGAILAEARRRGIRRIKVACLPENAAMQRLAARFRAGLRQEGANILGLIDHNPDA